MAATALKVLLLISTLLTGILADKDSLNVTCKMEGGQITVDIYTTKPLYNVQLKNADQSCEPQEFTETSIRFVIQNFQLGICGFTRMDNSATGLDGTFWNNIAWKNKPTSNTTRTTKVKCSHKLSAMLGSGMMPVPVRVHVIHLPFGAFPSAFSSSGIAGQDGMTGLSDSSPFSRSPFPPGIPVNGPSMAWLRSAGLQSLGLPGLSGLSSLPGLSGLSGFSGLPEQSDGVPTLHRR